MLVKGDPQVNHFSEHIDITPLANRMGNILTKFDVFAQRNVALSYISFQKVISNHKRFFGKDGDKIYNPLKIVCNMSAMLPP